ncbi:MAG: IS1595 family transposase [Candidatus Rokubacteria bacterium]|nr:IS1595 family transposase [Candidatus Rokubacteria bacterium]
MDTTLTAPATLLDAVRFFSDPDVCVAYMAKARWGSIDAVTCPTCGNRKVHYLESRRLWQCNTKHPRRQFSVKVGTIFEDSPLGLDKWLPAVWLITNAKNGVSSYEVARALGITQKSAWFMLHRIRLAMGMRSHDKMSGEVEVDETFIGGRARFMHAARRREKITGTGGSGKTAVMGLLERHGPDKTSRVKAAVVATTRKHVLQAQVRAYVEPGSAVYSDALKSYEGLAPDYAHAVINHAESYVRGKVHTNGLENFWSLVKRAIKGTYVSVEPFHLFRYLDEEVFRFNQRRDPHGDGGRFLTVLRAVVGKRLTFADLTTSSA